MQKYLKILNVVQEEINQVLEQMLEELEVQEPLKSKLFALLNAPSKHIRPLISILYLNFSGSLIIVALVFALLVLLIPYVMHYYLLENSVQKMYEQYDRMMNKSEPSFRTLPEDKMKNKQ